MNLAGILAGAAQRQTAMQQQAQAALPVIPNNGNPAGAFNMPAPTRPAIPVPAPVAPTQPAMRAPTPPAMTQPPVQSKYYYPWMNPSPAMDSVRQMLNRMGGNQPAAVDLEPQPMQQVGGVVIPQRR